MIFVRRIFFPHTHACAHTKDLVSLSERKDTFFWVPIKVSGGFLSLSFSRIHFIETEMHSKARKFLRIAFPAENIRVVYLLRVSTNELQDAYK